MWLVLALVALLTGMLTTIFMPVDIAEASTTPPSIMAPAAIAVDATSGRILFSKDMHNRRPMASTTKIMTALTALNIEGTNLADTYQVVKDDLVGETSMGLKNGEVVTFEDLLYGMMLPSGNDAAMAVAHYAGAKLPGTGPTLDRFLARMNQQAIAFGMLDSHYVNPHGFDDPQQYTSAYDLAISAWYAINNPVLSKVITTKTAERAGHKLTNINYLLSRYNGATGVKPGFDYQAGLCMVGSASRNGMSVISVVLGEDNARYQTEPAALLDYAFGQLQQPEIQTLIKQGPTPTSTDDYIGKVSGDRLLPLMATGGPGGVNIVNIPANNAAGGVLNAQINQTQATTTPDAFTTPTVDSGNATTSTTGGNDSSNNKDKKGGLNLFMILFILIIIVGIVYAVLRFTTVGGERGREYAYQMEDFAVKAWHLLRTGVTRLWHFVRPATHEEETGVAPARSRSVEQTRPEPSRPRRSLLDNEPLARPQPASRPLASEPRSTLQEQPLSRPVRPTQDTTSRRNPLDNFFDDSSPLSSATNKPLEPNRRAESISNEETPAPPRPLTNRPVEHTHPENRPPVIPPRPVANERNSESSIRTGRNPGAFAGDGADSVATRARQAVDYAYAGRYAASQEEFRRVVEQDALFDFASIDEFEQMPVLGFKALAGAYRDVGKPRFAVLLLDMAIETYPNDLELRNLQRVIKREMGQ